MTSVALFPHSLALTALGLAQRNPALFAPGHKPSLSLGIAEDSVPGNALSKTLEQAFWRLARLQYYFCQCQFSLSIGSTNKFVVEPSPGMIWKDLSPADGTYLASA